MARHALGNKERSLRQKGAAIGLRLGLELQPGTPGTLQDSALPVVAHPFGMLVGTMDSADSSLSIC